MTVCLLPPKLGPIWGLFAAARHPAACAAFLTEPDRKAGWMDAPRHFAAAQHRIIEALWNPSMTAWTGRHFFRARGGKCAAGAAPASHAGPEKFPEKIRYRPTPISSSQARMA